MSNPDPTDSSEFPTTHWSAVTVAGGAGGERDRREALGRVVGRYAGPLRAYLRRRRFTADAADELVQQFVADRMVDGNLLSRAWPDRRRFRGLLLTALRRFVANQSVVADGRPELARDSITTARALRLAARAAPGHSASRGHPLRRCCRAV